MYGETFNERGAQLPRRGLSPHVRGNLRTGCSCLTRTRSIPACTGKPRTSRLRSPSPRVYPRMYGETPLPHQTPAQTLGLSPHVRGNRRNADDHRIQLGSIPACTGKPQECDRGRVFDAVYPRMYGETLNAVQTDVFNAGLSPHVRGNLGPRRLTGTGTGSIPACTGKPVGEEPVPQERRVYPRMYGETV